MAAEVPPAVSLRPTVWADVPSLFGMQLDPVSNQLAGTKPREWETFSAHWEEILRDPVGAGVTPRVIVVDGTIVGSIDVFKREGVEFIGYWLARGQWGRGIAGRAIALMLGEVATRPLFARVAGHNAASLRALARNGFVVTSRLVFPGTDRYVGGETVTLTLV